MIKVNYLLIAADNNVVNASERFSLQTILIPNRMSTSVFPFSFFLKHSRPL